MPTDEMRVRYGSIDELLSVARRDVRVVRSNSLAGVFVWLPDVFERERAAGEFPANAEVQNFWLHDAKAYWRSLATDIDQKQREIEVLRHRADAVWKFSEHGKTV